MDADGTPAPRVEAVLLDALGTLVGLEPPVAHLVAELAARGVAVTPEAAGVAVHQEIAHYRAEHHRAGTPAGLRVLRAECAAILRAALAPAADGLDAATMADVLLGSFRFFAYPEAHAVLRGLRARGLATVVCSNWDVSLHDVLAATGLDALVDGVVVSAVEGVSKPDAELFTRALIRGGGVDATAALHVGDSVAADVVGAQAAGVGPVLVARGSDELRSHDDGGPIPAGVPVIADLRGLLALV